MTHSSLKIILASTSVFRRKILGDAGFEFEVLAPTCDEKSITGLPPRELARARSELKGFDVANRSPANSYVIGADQVLGIKGQSFDKAESADEAHQRLTEFSDQLHFLHSGICIYKVDEKNQISLVFSDVVDVPMMMRKLSGDEIDAYLKTNEWQGVVGCYRIEGEGRRLFVDVYPDNSAIIGLPLKPLQDFFRLQKV